VFLRLLGTQAVKEFRVVFRASNRQMAADCWRFVGRGDELARAACVGWGWTYPLNCATLLMSLLRRGRRLLLRRWLLIRNSRDELLAGLSLGNLRRFLLELLIRTPEQLSVRRPFPVLVPVAMLLTGRQLIPLAGAR
jgi:hypothetical protein